MNSFEAMGQAQLQAAEGSRQIAAAFAGWLNTVATKLMRLVAQQLQQDRPQHW